jgi:hypothetical protein
LGTFQRWPKASLATASVSFAQAHQSMRSVRATSGLLLITTRPTPNRRSEAAWQSASRTRPSARPRFSKRFLLLHVERSDRDEQLRRWLRRAEGMGELEQHWTVAAAAAEA